MFWLGFFLGNLAGIVTISIWGHRITVRLVKNEMRHGRTELYNILDRDLDELMEEIEQGEKEDLN